MTMTIPFHRTQCRRPRRIKATECTLVLLLLSDDKHCVSKSLSNLLRPFTILHVWNRIVNVNKQHFI